MPRTPLFGALRRAVRLADAANRARIPADEIIGWLTERPVSRRAFLRRSAAAAAAVGGGWLLPGCRTPGRAEQQPRIERDARIAIVGAGIAGLNAAHVLRKSGVGAVLYEGSQRIGGRMFSARDLLGPGLTTELGGEFLDTSHTEVLELAKELDLGLIDTAAPQESDLVREAYFFEGALRPEREVIEAFQPLAISMRRDLESLPGKIDFEHGKEASAIDRLSITEYLDRIEASGFVRSLLEAAYVTEYGLDSQEQSALNLLLLIGLETEPQFNLLGESDERFKILGGNQQIPERLAERMADTLRLGHRLIAVHASGSGYELTFAVNGRGGTTTASADVVILAIPCPLLRDVELRVALHPAQHRAIRELGMGTNAKLLVGFERRMWRELGYSGTAYSDEGFQLCWDNSRMQDTTSGGMTLYSGGKAGLDVLEGAPGTQVMRLLPGVEKVFPGVGAASNRRAERMHWPSYPWSRGSYACYKPGQWTTLNGAAGLPAPNLYFAGEHCSIQWQGFMNGAAETGRLAAEAILARVRA